MSRPRDSQRSRLYDAERAPFVPPGRGLPTVEDMQAYADAVVASKALTSRFGPLPLLTVRPGYGHRWATSERASSSSCILQMPRWSRRELWLLHEIAHGIVECCDVDGWAPRPRAWHGWEFTSTFLALVRNRMGADAHKALHDGMRRYRVRYTSPRRLSDEQRAALRERGRQLAASRPTR